MIFNFSKALKATGIIVRTIKSWYDKEEDD